MLLALAPGSLGSSDHKGPQAKGHATAPGQQVQSQDRRWPKRGGHDKETGVDTPAPPAASPPPVSEVGKPVQEVGQGERPGRGKGKNKPGQELPDTGESGIDNPGSGVAGKPNGNGQGNGNSSPGQQPTAPSTPSASAPPPAPASLSEPSSGGDRKRSARFRRRANAASRSDGGASGTAGTETATPADDSTAGATGGGSAPAGGDSDQGSRERSGGGNEDDARAGDEDSSIVTRTVRDIVEVVPESLKIALAALAALSVLLGAGYLITTMRARRLERQRRELLQEVGLLQSALLPPVPATVGALRTSVAYRPADGPGAGGDFYDVVPLAGGRVGFVLGDVSGHGRGALARTAFMRYTLRAYLEAGLEPRVALQVAGRVMEDNLGGDFATVLIAVHDPETGSLTYAAAGHPAPIVVGPHEHEPVTAASSPPIGIGERTGLRQTTLPLVPGSVAVLFTDGLTEARTEGGMLGRERLEEMLRELGPQATAAELIERVRSEARVLSDDIAACVVSPTDPVTAGSFRSEQLELSASELDGPLARRFLETCGVPGVEIALVERDARPLAERFGGVVLHVVFGNRLRVELLPRNVESIEVASRRAAAAGS